MSAADAAGIELVAYTYRVPRYKHAGKLYLDDRWASDDDDAERIPSGGEQFESNLDKHFGNRLQGTALMPDDAYYITIYTPGEDDEPSDSDDNLILLAIKEVT